MPAALILVANPGSASRKYAVYHGVHPVARLHFEPVNGRMVCNRWTPQREDTVTVDLDTLAHAASLVEPQLEALQVLDDDGGRIHHIALRIVAPSSYFLRHHELSDDLLWRLEAALPRAPLHVTATLEELRFMRHHFTDARIFGASDSAFHATKPDFAWNYGLPLHDADEHDIKRFGYHGLSVASAVDALHEADKLAHKVVVCHLGGGASVTAVQKGHSYDTTMGYSPLEGLIMATRSGSVDPSAVRDLKQALGLDDEAMEHYLYEQSGLYGLSGISADIRDLLAAESSGDHRAELAMNTYVHTVQKAIGQMIGAMGGIDALVFTGTVGERSATLRERIMEKLEYVDLLLDKHHNAACTHPQGVECISRLAHSRPVYVAPADEAGQMAKIVRSMVAG